MATHESYQKAFQDAFKHMIKVELGVDIEFD